LTAGVGAEWAVTSNWLVKVEYDYVDFGTTNYNVTNGPSRRSGHRAEPECNNDAEYRQGRRCL
jgi:opacity protein-like surface antigen